MTKLEEIGDICRWARTNANLSITDLASMIDRPKNRINAIEMGRVHMNEYEAKTYSDLFGIPLSKIWHPLQYRTGYELHKPLTEIKNELQVKSLPYRDIAAATGIDEKRLRQFIVKNTKVFATGEEATILAKYFGKENILFLAYPKRIRVCDKNETKEEPTNMTSNIKEVEIKEEVVSEVKEQESSDIWRDKAHELHRQLGEARREIERLRDEKEDSKLLDEAQMEIDHWKDIYCALEKEYKEQVAHNEKLGEKIAQMSLTIEKLTKENMLKASDDGYREKYDTLETAFNALEKENNTYKELILKITVKAADWILKELS